MPIALLVILADAVIDRDALMRPPTRWGCSIT